MSAFVPRLDLDHKTKNNYRRKKALRPAWLVAAQNDFAATLRRQYSTFMHVVSNWTMLFLLLLLVVKVSSNLLLTDLFYR